MEKIYLDEKGYNVLKNEINDLKNQLIEVRKEKTEAIKEAHGMTLENIDFGVEDAKRKENMLISLIVQKEIILSEAILIEEEKKVDIVNINDLITVSLKFKDDDEQFTFKLVGKNNGCFSDNLEVSINSPMGKAIYNKKIGDNVSYVVENEKVILEIIKIQKEFSQDLNKIKKI